MIRNKVVINKDILLDLGFDKYYNWTLFDSYENKKHNTILIYNDRVEVYMGVHSRTFKPDDISRFIHFIKSMINNSILLNAEDLLRAYNFKRINAINIVYLKYIKDIFIKIVLSNNIIYLQFYIQSGNIRRSKRFIDKQEFIDYLKQLMNGKTKL